MTFGTRYDGNVTMTCGTYEHIMEGRFGGDTKMANQVMMGVLLSLALMAPDRRPNRAYDEKGRPFKRYVTTRRSCGCLWEPGGLGGIGKEYQIVAVINPDRKQIVTMWWSTGRRYANS